MVEDHQELQEEERAYLQWEVEDRHDREEVHRGAFQVAVEAIVLLQVEVLQDTYLVLKSYH